MDNIVDYMHNTVTPTPVATQETATTTAPEVTEQAEKPLRESIKEYLDGYFNQLGQEAPSNLYKKMLKHVELPLLVGIMKYTRNNQSRAAKLLNISRGTLRKKLKIYGLL